MKPIRILQVFTIMNRGGAESMIMNYYRHIDRNKVQFDFLVHRLEKGAFDDEIEALGGNIFRMSPINFFKIKKYRRELNAFFLEHDEYQVVHSHLNAISKYVLKAAKEFNIPVRIAHSHIALTKVTFSFLFDNAIDWKQKIKIIYKQAIKNSVKKYANSYFACGLDAGIWLFNKVNIENVKIINNAIDSKQFQYNKEVAEDNKLALKLKNKFVIGHVGRFNLQKNHDFLIDIFKVIHTMHPKSVLFLLGEGDLKKAIEIKVNKLGLKDAVCFFGVQSDIPYYLQVFDVFLFPSLYEGLPVTLIEAQAAGLKTIVSDQVSEESKLTNFVEFVSLDESANFWADKVLKYKSGYVREVTSDVIAKMGYDIKANALELQKFYLKQYER